jgi:hypothetical protein
MANPPVTLTPEAYAVHINPRHPIRAMAAQTAPFATGPAGDQFICAKVDRTTATPTRVPLQEGMAHRLCGVKGAHLKNRFLWTGR